MIYFSKLPGITKGKILSLSEDRELGPIITDSRKAVSSPNAIFFAIKGVHHDGHQYIRKLYETGVRQFVIERNGEEFTDLNNCNFLQVNSSVQALQLVAAFHRQQFRIPIIGITGSNGKTIIKEWLYQLLSEDHKIAKNPGSYNSQLGVPLSVLQLRSHHQMGIFEAGISRKGEMQNLENIIKPTIGIFTNIGTAHDEGFANLNEKVEEKLKLFKESKSVIYCRDHERIKSAVAQSGLQSFTWSFQDGADVSIRRQDDRFNITTSKESFDLALPFSDQASVENCFHCIALMLYLGYSSQVIAKRIQSLRSVPMRLELKEGINNCLIVDDTYNNDLAGLQISLEFLSNQNQRKKKTLILSDILESGLTSEDLAKRVSQLMASSQVNRFIGIGKQLSSFRQLFSSSSRFFEVTDDFLNQFDFSELDGEVILVKGARTFTFEKIVNRLQKKVHGTVMEIDLGALVDNLNFFKARLKPETKIMVMVKAFAYGSGSIEIANLLQYHKTDYLGVAYADEGVELRKNNISLPVMVMNPSEESFDVLIKNNLEPEMYSFRILKSYLKFLDGKKSVIHIKLDTGMHRLGFNQEDINSLKKILAEYPEVKVASIFSHLAGADDAQHDHFSNEQAVKFKVMADEVSKSLGYQPIYHILNSPGILRLPELQFDMVRLGIGLYGVDPTEENFSELKPVATLKTVISQIKKIAKGETIGYGRRGKAEREISIATIAIGYADGFSRAFSRGVGEVMIHGKTAKVIGNVCMDMTMVDITGIDAKEGDEVIIFGKDFPIQAVAKKINTIPYEILTNTSERVKRVFVAESI